MGSLTGETQPRDPIDRAADPRLIAFYLPQFHPIPENDAWWGTGFTEWTNAAGARPQYRGHAQPHLPADLGFYDLRLPEAREAQARLAQAFGIHGFCYYHYWFEGRRLLQAPLDAVLASGAPAMPFCLCWANERWTRTWDGGDQHVLVEQRYSDEDDRAHIRWLGEVFRDPRYIRVEGRPLFLVYRADALPDARRTTACWRAEAARLGVGDPYLVRVDSFDDRTDPADGGFDAAVEFAPDVHRLGTPVQALPEWRRAHGDGAEAGGHRVYRYDDVVRLMLEPREELAPRIPCVMPGWDNSARRDRGALIIDGSTPDAYRRWLRAVIARERERSATPLVFINAWNEWAEGAHLEPCQRWGRAYLQATRDALDLDASSAPAELPAPSSAPPTSGLHYTRRYDDPDHAHALTLSLVKGARRVLDVGAATGYLSEAMVEQGADVVAVEVDPRAAAVAASRGVAVRVGTVDDTVDPHEQFDCVLAADVLEHVVDADAFLESVLRHLSPGGHLVLSVPNVAYVTLRTSLARGRFDYTDTGLLDRTHVRFYTKRSLGALLAAHGLTVVDRRYSVGPSVLAPLRFAPLDRGRRRLLRSLAWRWPELCAFQFILKLRRADDPAG